jgi:hypothetical protein
MGVQDDYNEAWEAGRDDERERCRLLCVALAEINRAQAQRIRTEGAFKYRTGIWPFGRVMTAVRPGYERMAVVYDEKAHSCDLLTRCTVAGYDPRKKGE